MEEEILAQELRPRGGQGASGKGRHRTYWVEEAGEWSMWLGESHDLDEMFDGGDIHYVGKQLPHQVHPSPPPTTTTEYPDDWAYYGSEWEYYPTEWGSGDYDAAWWYDDLPPEQVKELEEAYALVDQKARNFVEARQAVKARNLSRGFYPYVPSIKGGSFKGKKGKGKPKGKGFGKAPPSSPPPILAATTHPGTDEDGSGFLGAAVGDAAYTGCFICGNKSHDFRHCPKRQTKGQGRGAVHFAADVGTIYFTEDFPGASSGSGTPSPVAIYAIEEDGADNEIFSQDASEDLSGYAVLDSGATETVASLPALEALMRARERMRSFPMDPSFQVLDQPPKKFKFGNGEFAVSSSYLLLPQQIGDHQVDLGIYTLDVVGVPILLGIKTMVKLHAVVDFVHCRAVFASIDAGLVVPLKRSRSGQLLVSLKDNWLQQGHRLDARTKQLDPGVGPKESTSAAFMVQEVCQQEQSCTSEPALDARDTGVAEPDPLEVPPPSQECPGLVMTSSTAPQPSAVQALDSMKALTILTGLLALQDGRACSLKEEGYQEGERPAGRGEDGGPGPSRPSHPGSPLLWQAQGGEGVQGKCLWGQPVRQLDRVRGLQAEALLHSSHGVSWDSPEERAIGKGCDRCSPRSSLRHRELPFKPRDFAVGSRELRLSSLGAPTASSKRIGKDYQGQGGPLEDPGPIQQDHRGGPVEDPGPIQQDHRGGPVEDSGPIQQDHQERPVEDPGPIQQDHRGGPRETQQSGVSNVESTVSWGGVSGSRRATSSCQSEGIQDEHNSHRGLGGHPVNDSDLAESHHVSLSNELEVESFAEYLIALESYDYQSMEALIETMQPRAVRPGRQSVTPGRKDAFSLVFGLYAHGNFFGCTKDSARYPTVARFFNECLRRLPESQGARWTSLTVLVNMRGAMHLDAHNSPSTGNLALGLGNYQGGELWVELRDGDPSVPGLPVTWREVPGKKKVPGQARPTWHSPTWFSPKRYHRTLPWTGTRYAIVAFTARSWEEASLDGDLRGDLQRLHFPLPPPSRLPSGKEPVVHLAKEDQLGDEDLLPLDEEWITEEHRSSILATFTNYEDALKEIFFQYPNEKFTKVAHLCTPWWEPLAMEQTMQACEWSYQILSHGDGCDLSTHSGFQRARHELSKLKAEWLWCHVPKGPQQLFANAASWSCPKMEARAKKYLRTLRHLLLLSRDHALGGGKLIWFIPSGSEAGDRPRVPTLLELLSQRTTVQASGRSASVLQCA